MDAVTLRNAKHALIGYVNDTGGALLCLDASAEDVLVRVWEVLAAKVDTEDKLAAKVDRLKDEVSELEHQVGDLDAQVDKLKAARAADLRDMAKCLETEADKLKAKLRYLSRPTL